jgi:hypothetical protein
VVAPALANYALVKSMGREKEYRELPAYRRDFFWNIPLPGDHWLTLPKPFELGVMGSGVERAVDMAVTGDFSAMEGWGHSLFTGITPADEALFMGPFKSGVEAMTNYDMFRERHIVPPWEAELALDLRPGAREASRLGQLIGSIGMDPRKVEHIVTGLLGDYGRLAVNLSSIGVEGNETTLSETLARASGVLRQQTPYSLRSVQDVLEREKRLGLNRTREARAFRERLQRARKREGGNLQKLIDRARERSKQLESVTVEDREKELFGES